MMSRSELDTIRTRLADAAHLDGDTAHEMALELHAELERSRMREALQRAEHADLLAAARATIAAGDGQDHLIFLRHELDRHGQLPDAGQTPAQILADAAAVRPRLAGQPTEDAPGPSEWRTAA